MPDEEIVLQDTQDVLENKETVTVSENTVVEVPIQNGSSTLAIQVDLTKEDNGELFQALLEAINQMNGKLDTLIELESPQIEEVLEEEETVSENELPNFGMDYYEMNSLDMLEKIYDNTKPEETVSENTVSENTIMDKPLEEYNTTEGLLLATFLMMVVFFFVWLFVGGKRKDD